MDIDLTSKQDEYDKEESYNPKVFDDFFCWFNDMVQLIKPDLIVAIARGAIRLLELHGIDEQSISAKLICDTALPFLNDAELRKKRILIFDDSLIFGSTMANIREYLLSRNSIPFCSAFVVDRKNFFGERKIDNEFGTPSKYCNMPLEYCHKLWPAEIRSHHDLLVRKILDSPNHYNLDFPTIEFRMNKNKEINIYEFIDDLCLYVSRSRSFEVSSAESAANHIYRFSILMPIPSNNLFSNSFVKFKDYTKIRLTYDRNRNSIQLTPIIQLCMLDDEMSLTAPFKNRVLNDFWQALNKASKNDSFYLVSTFRLMTSFVAMILLKSLEGFINTQKDILELDGNCHFVEKDFNFGLGYENTSILMRIFKDISEEDIIDFNFNTQINNIVKHEDTEQLRLIRLILLSWESRNHLKPHKYEVVYEMLGKIFWTLRQITDSYEIRKVNPGIERISTGLSYDSLEYLLNEQCECELSKDEISIGVDICVDNGQAVPKIVNSFFGLERNFYSGERSDSIDPIQFKNYFYEAYVNFTREKKSKYLTPFELHKLCVTLKDIYPWLPISTKNNIYGRTAMPEAIDQDLILWLSSGLNSPLNLSCNNDGQTIVKPSQEYKVCMQSAWSKDKARNINDGIYYISNVFTKLKQEHKLLMSTCLTHKHTFNSIAYEAHAWSHKGNFNFNNIAFSGKLKTYELRNASKELVDNLFWCIQYIVEAHKKWYVFFKDFNPVRNKIENVFRGFGFTYLNFWNYELSTKITNEKDPDIELKFSFLMPIIQQMRELTHYCIRLLLKCNVITFDSLEKKFQKEGIKLYTDHNRWFLNESLESAVLQYNSKTGDNISQGRSILLTRLPETGIFNQDSKKIDEMTILDIVSQCYLEIHEYLVIFCPEYKTLEGDFPFSPNNRQRKRFDGSEEIYIKNSYILALDIIGSTDSKETNLFKDNIISVLSRFSRSNLFYEITGNDAYLICADEPFVLIDICQAICVEGKTLITKGEKLQGTRKGFGFGAVSIHIDNNKRIRIMDGVIPNVIPKTFSMLSGIDEISSEYEKNSLVIVDNIFLEKFKESLISFKIIDTLKKYKFKHCYGNYSVYKLY